MPWRFKISSRWLEFFVVLVVSVISLLRAEIPQDKLRKLEEAHIIPDYGKYLNHFVVAQVKFEGPPRITADFGNFIDLRTLPKDPPEIRWVAEAGEYYTVALIDPDVPRDPPQPAEKMHWLLINVPGCWLPGGQEVIPYSKPENPKTEGEVHRIISLVYHQLEGQMNITEPFLRSEEITESMRNTFRIRKFAEKYDLMFPVALNFFRAKFLDPKQPLKGPKSYLNQNQQRKLQKQQNKQKQQHQQQNKTQQMKNQQQYHQAQEKQHEKRNNAPTKDSDVGKQQRQQQEQKQKEQKQGEKEKNLTPGVAKRDDLRTTRPLKTSTVKPMLAAYTKHQLEKERREQENKTKSELYHEDLEKNLETATLSQMELARRQDILNTFRQRDQQTQDRQHYQEQIRDKAQHQNLKTTTINPILAAYMKDHLEKKRQKQHKKKEKQGKEDIQMPDVPDWDEVQQLESEKSRSWKTTTMNPILAAYLMDLLEKEQRKPRKHNGQRKQKEDEIEIPEIPDWEDLLDESERTGPNKQTTMNPILAAYMRDIQEKKKRKKQGQSTQEPVTSNS